tara:strand:- start:478 stop:702 length:225 start_codon:yes stop_codon:yes gene_type:complete
MHSWYPQNQPDLIIAFRSKIFDYFQSLGCKVPKDFGIMFLNWSSRIGDFSGYRRCREEIGEIAVNIVFQTALQQ